MNTRIASQDELRTLVEVMYESRLKIPEGERSRIFWGNLQNSCANFERKERLVGTMFHVFFLKDTFRFSLNPHNGLVLKIVRVDNKFLIEVLGDDYCRYQKEVEIITEAVDAYNLILNKNGAE